MIEKDTDNFVQDVGELLRSLSSDLKSSVAEQEVILRKEMTKKIYHNLVSFSKHAYDLGPIFTIAHRYRNTGDLEDLATSLEGVYMENIPVNLIIDLVTGVWSGFPDCCVLNYLSGNYALIMDCYRPSRVGYVSCVKCLDTNNVVKDIRKGHLAIDSLGWYMYYRDGNRVNKVSKVRSAVISGSKWVTKIKQEINS